MKKIVLVCALALGVTAVSAQSEGMGMGFHPYVNVMAGSTSGSLKYEGEGTSGKATVDTTFGYALNVGAMFNKYFGAELNYTDFGKAKEKDTGGNLKVGTTAFGLNLKGVLPIADQFNAYAKVGFASGTAAVEGQSSTSGDGFAYAVGFGYDIDKAMGVSLEYNALSFSKTQKVDAGLGQTISLKTTHEPSMIAATFTYNF
jgi:OmpA-OmpF porin, OOP family